ncbi:MAG: ComEC family competence protein [Rickettsiales bacterium]|jgi:competence protein ComEC|nr:ComEC family competence protein [Rickettsiales bacterium]
MREFLKYQYQNLFLWTPFATAAGAILYFSCAAEPKLAYPMLIAILAAAILTSRRTGVVMTASLLFIFGFFYACGFTKLIDTPQMIRNIRNANIAGVVTNIDYTNDKPRIFVRIPANLINKNLAENKTALVRLSAGGDHPLPKIGGRINARATLFKLAGPAAPGSFDYARWAYFNGISATGYLDEYNENPAAANKSAEINNMRDYIHHQTNSFLADTLVLGYKNAVPKDDASAWTTTGVGHVWSISGFHITLVSGWLFVFFYLVFRSIAPIARRFPARYPAIICAWLGLLLYLFLSGADVATIRAFLMTTLVFAAFILGRNVFSLRNVCIAFLLIFMLNPHYVMQPGFQLSFAAIFGLIWFFEDRKHIKTSMVEKILRIIKAAIMTSIIATIFTAPFVAYHFYSLPVYGLIGNLILLPVFSFAIMPLVMIGTITALSGFHSPLIWSENIYSVALNLAHKIAELPFATVQIPPITGPALFLMAAGLLCLMFIKNTDRFKHANYLLFLVFASAGAAMAALNPRPLFYATDDHELVAFVRNDKLEFNKARASNHYFAFESWKHLNYERPDSENTRRKCDKGVCVYKTPNWTLAYIQRYAPLSKNIAILCRDPGIDFIVSYFHIDSAECDRKILRGGFVIHESGRIKYTPSKRWWHGNAKF